MIYPNIIIHWRPVTPHYDRAYKKEGGLFRELAVRQRGDLS